jgi:hypothetical protein
MDGGGGCERERAGAHTCGPAVACRRAAACRTTADRFAPPGPAAVAAASAVTAKAPARCAGGSGGRLAGRLLPPGVKPQETSCGGGLMGVSEAE